MSTLIERTISLVLNEHKVARRARRTASPAPAVPGRRAPVLTRAELASCTCPDPCERDHEND